MNKTILEKKDNTFKIDSINLNIFSDTYINDYVTISFYLYNEDRPLPVENTFNISHELFDFIHIKEKWADTFIFNIKYTHPELKDDFGDNIKVYNDTFENSGIGVLNLYEAIFKVDYIDKNNWERFIHVLALKENELVIDKSDENLDNHGIFNYDKCFKKSGSKHEIDNKYIEKQMEFLHFSSLLATNSYTYVLNNTKELIISFLCNFFRYNPNKTIKKCEHCQKWFIPDKKTTKYCDRVSPKYKNKNCKEAAALINKLLNEKSNDIKYLRKKIRMKYYNPVNNYERQEDIERLEKFDNDDKVWQNKLKNNEATIPQYKKWLNSHYVRKQVKGVK
jgi:hypothetical protein